MKKIDWFLWKEINKTFRHADIGFVIDDVQSYNEALGSVRIRCYDIILAMERAGVKAELYRPFKKYKTVIFTKTRTDKSVQLAKKLKNQGVRVVSDNFCEYLTDESRSDDWERQNILKILEYSDLAIVYSKEQYKQFSQYHDQVYFINESVCDNYFQVCKKHEKKEHVTLIYSGYRSNARHTELIASAICRLQEEFGCKVLFICEEDPKIQSFPYQYRHYEQKDIASVLLQGDIMIAPRPMEGIEKMQYTVSKIAIPMAVGLPVIASPVPAYEGTPAILCSCEEDWYRELRRLIVDEKERAHLGALSREYVKKNLTSDIIAKEYLAKLHLNL